MAKMNLEYGFMKGFIMDKLLGISGVTVFMLSTLKLSTMDISRYEFFIGVIGAGIVMLLCLLISELHNISKHQRLTNK